MIINQKKTIILLTIMSLPFQLLGFFPINFFKPWDINLRPPEWCGAPLQLTGYYEGGLKANGFNADNQSVNVMQIFNSTQDSLAMLKGFPANSPESIFFNTILMDPQDDGVRGHFTVTGNFNLLANAVLCGRYHFAHNIMLGVFLPVLSMRLHDVKFTDLTQDITAEDDIVKENLTDNFLQNIKQFDPALNLTGWSKTGLGDMAVMGEWLQYFPQEKEYLKNVGLNIRAGATIPTGFKTDVNEILFVPLGFDGAWGLFFGAGIIINWFNYIRAGVDFEFLNLFGANSVRRIKTQADQTDFLFLAKTRVHTEYGFTQRYNLFGELYQIYRGLSASVIYQFWKHSEDKLGLFSNDFSTQIANTAQNLQDWTIHQFIFKVDYDFQSDIDDDAFIKPQLQFFYKLPFNGSRALVVHTIGAGITFNF
jgi:hypothetical protein